MTSCSSASCAARLRAVLDAGEDGMTEDEFGLRVVKALWIYRRQ